jgi:hypothetical protein
MRTTVNFEATFGGHAKIWWSDADGSASRETFDEPSEARLYPSSWSPAEFVAPAPGQGMILRNWLICGPFGGLGAEQFVWDPPGKMKDDVQAFFNKAVYPPDSGAFDRAATFTGPMISGWWKPENNARWLPATVAELDARVHLGRGGAQVWYATTWIRAEAATEVQMIIHSGPQARIRVNLDDKQVFDGQAKKEEGNAWLSSTVPVTLSPGWHRLQIRTYAWGYGSAKAGVAIAAPLEQMWGLRAAGQPPIE